MVTFLEWYYNYFVRSVYTQKIREKGDLRKYAGHWVMDESAANQWIADAIVAGDKSFRVARFGATELSLIRKFLSPIKNEKMKAAVEQFCKWSGFSQMT